jgi:low affinity Fe/Cu permease
MNIVKIASICIISTVICKLFDKNSHEYALYIKISAAVIVLSFMFIYISPLIENIRSIFEHSQADTDYLKISIGVTDAFLVLTARKISKNYHYHNHKSD